jgi:hypothetical protein
MCISSSCQSYITIGVTVAPLGLIAAHTGRVTSVRLMWPCHIISSGSSSNDGIRLWTLLPLPSLVHSFAGYGHGIRTFVATDSPRTIWSIPNNSSSSTTATSSPSMVGCVAYQFSFNRHACPLSNLLT